MTIREFRPDPSGLAALRVHTEDVTVVPLTEAIFDDSQRYVPVLTGDLRASGRTLHDGGTGYVIYGDDGDVDYAVYQEVGTTVMSAQPYLRPAAYRVRAL